MDDCLNLLREILTRLYIYIFKTFKKKKLSIDTNNLITDSNFTYFKELKKLYNK